ncbi:MAG: DeoR/GlpR family DNA-binding transcription regulator [Candidatus Flemingiibacterium sp.]
MFASERHEIILNMLKTQHSVTVSELTEKFGLSIETIRRDLAALESRNLLTRVHGGAVAVSDGMRVFNSLSDRIAENQEYKRELSQKAAELVKENDVIALDAGSTAREFAKVLGESFTRLKIVTYSLDIINMLCGKSDFSFILIGGDFNPAERVFGGFLASESMKRLHVSKSFIFSSAVSLKYGITITLSDFYELERALMSISDHSYILADSTKFETASPIRLCGLNEVDAIVTDSRLDDRIARLYAENGINLLRWKS